MSLNAVITIDRLTDSDNIRESTCLVKFCRTEKELRLVKEKFC